MPSFSSSFRQRTSLRAPSVPSAVTRNFGTTKSDRPLVPWGAPEMRASTMWTMLGAVLDCAAAQRAEIRARLRLGQVHRAGPFAADDLGEIGRALLGRAMRDQEFGG